MHEKLLSILRCPLCGSALTLAQGPQQRRGAKLWGGVLSCECSEFPVVAGIPVLLDDYYGQKLAKTALWQVRGGDPEQALFTLLDIPQERHEAMRQLVSRGAAVTYREAMAVFRPDDEETYFAYRWSDPTFVVSQAVWRALGSDPRVFTRPVLDLCGGSGHLTRLLSSLATGTDVLLTDLDFWKLWLAREMIAPGCQPVCCNADLPLPFADGAFSAIACSDAFHYVRAKQLLAREMVRLVGTDGVIALTHLHNRFCKNPAPGSPLSPAWYRQLFEGYGARVFRESGLLDKFLSGRVVDLTQTSPDDQLQMEPALCLIATRLQGVCRVYEGLGAQQLCGTPRINPLYILDESGAAAFLRRQFPSASYEAEFEVCKRYLPERVQLPEGALEAVRAGRWDDVLKDLSECFIILDLPRRY
jgi:SAM-dependent methyltransferase/uncharacterized protein YbaR (Trm112 family)